MYSSLHNSASSYKKKYNNKKLSETGEKSAQIKHKTIQNSLKQICVDFNVRDNRRWTLIQEDALLWINYGHIF